VVFDGLLSFPEFESRINQLAEEKDRGDVFEIFIEGYLATQSIAQCKEHWVVGSIPLALRERYNLPSDGTGIDGIYEATDGTHVAYQVKYRQKSNLTYQEVAPFLGLTERFTDRVIFTNAATLAHQAVARTRWVSRQDFLSLTPEALNEITSWIVGKPVERKRAEPDPRYQTQVLADIATALETNSRATVVMACGTGKTLVALWAVEQAKPKTVLVLLPSLSLVQQTVREWGKHHGWGSRFSFICVCSDATVANDVDVLELDTSDVGFRVDTDPATVNRFLATSDDAVRVVFSTYQSSDVVAEGAKGLPAFDIAVFDEAHKTTGLAGGQFSRALSDDHIPINKRLFFTATPRHIDIRSKRDKDGEYKVQSMDDPAVYGPRAHTLSFKAAADKGVICPYRVVISVVNKDLVDDFARKNGITLVDGDEVGVRWVSNLVALQQAIDQTGATKAITFHSRVKLAEEFASDSPRGIGRFLDGFEVRHVNGKQHSSDRAERIKSFAESPKGIITNARCLTEGVDIPAVDMVAFIDPRQSRVDIAQAVGRAMRKPRGATKKTVGYVFVPLFVGSEGESIDDAIKSERFDAVADVLNALQEHDEELVDLIREARQARGEGKPFKPRVLGDKVMMIGPRVELSRVVESVETRLVETLGSSWDEYFGILKTYVDQCGTADVESNVVWFDRPLGHWVATQRSLYRQGQLASARISRLESLTHWIWDKHDSNWLNNFDSLRRELQRTKLADLEKRRGVPVVNWMLNQRLRKINVAEKTGRKPLTKNQQAMLEGLPGWTWSRLDDRWSHSFDLLVRLIRTKGRLPSSIEKIGTVAPRRWLMKQLAKWQTLLPSQQERLLLIPEVKELRGSQFLVKPENMSEGEIKLLAFLLDTTPDSGASPAFIAESCGMNNSAVSVAVKRLIEKSHISYRKDDEDGRSKFIFISENSVELAKACRKYVHDKKFIFPLSS
jgi:superfamily II DNA or RNA helicase/DNA-binding MarR family transcriptional regulator